MAGFAARLTRLTRLTTTTTTTAGSGRQKAQGSGAGYGHGKVILLGEHTVVFGHPAIAAGLPEPFGVRAKVSAGTGHIQAAPWTTSARIGDASLLGKALGQLFETMGVAPSWDVILESGIPPGGGLGSSAATAVAVARALASLVDDDGPTGTRQTRVQDAIMAAETVFHGKPSGVDAAAAQNAGFGLFSKQDGWRRPSVRQSIKLCVGLTGQTRSTADMVAAVGHLRAREPTARAVLDTLAQTTGAGLHALEIGDVDGLGRQFDIAHGLLSALRLSTPAIDTLVHEARAAGALGAKLTGAGGGGAVIALAPAHRRDVLERWKAAGFDGFEVTLAP